MTYSAIIARLESVFTQIDLMLLNFWRYQIHTIPNNSQRKTCIFYLHYFAFIEAIPRIFSFLLEFHNLFLLSFYRLKFSSIIRKDIKLTYIRNPINIQNEQKHVF